MLLLGGRDWQPADAGGQPDILAQPGDLLMLGGEPGEGPVAEGRELADRGVRPGEAFLQPGDLVLEPGGLGIAGSGRSPGIAEFPEPQLELFAQAA